MQAPFNSRSQITALLGLMIVGLVVNPASVNAIEDPPGCSIPNGGLGNTSVGGIGFNRSQAHVGDTVPVFPSLGMASGACRAINATGIVYIATGPLTNFLINVTLDPGGLSSCPAGVCQPGPYNVLITPALVGAGVNSPNGSVPGAARTVRAVENGFGTVLTDMTEPLSDFHTASIGIVSPCIQVVKQCAYPAGTTCFPPGAPIQFAGYVTNCGDIRLTNVTMLDRRTSSLTVLSNGVPALPFGGPYTLSPGGVLTYSASFTPTAQETSAGTAANTITVQGTDITLIGGPNASVTNQASVSCAICPISIENPPGCSLANGGLGNTSQGGVGFDKTQAHVGDTVPVHASLGMVSGACQAINLTGTIYIATGLLTNFLVNITLNPGELISCPGDATCQPGPYHLTITPALVGAGVASPNGSVPGASKVVRVVQNGTGIVLTGDPPEQLGDFHTGTIRIVSPCIQVVGQCAYPAGTNCFPEGAPIQFTGYVTNCGDIRLTNVLVGSRAAMLLDTTPSHLPLVQPLALDPGQAVPFQGSFTPTSADICAGGAAGFITARGTDITVIGGPNASVTNSTTLTCAICRFSPCLTAPAYTVSGQFQFNVTGRTGSNYVIQVSTNLAAANWLSLLTNAAPFTFVESNAVLYPLRFYRAVSRP